MSSGFFTENPAPDRRSLSRPLAPAKPLLAFALLAIGLCPAPSQVASAQTRVSPAVPDAPAAQEQQPQEKRLQETLGTTFDLLSSRSVFFPELAHQRGPLTTQQKAELAADISIAPSRFVSSLLTSAVDQARDANPGYGQGWDAYGKRFGSSLATTASANVFGNFVLASAFHEDPRYFVKVNGTSKQKIANALERVVRTRSDSGRPTPNWSGLLGDLLAESLANTYLPQNERTTGKTFQRYGTRVGLGAAVNIFKEYWPSIFKSLKLAKIAPAAS